jgi:D-arginine dehydrogenase
MRIKIAVIGAGIAGVSIAAALAPHADVLILEAESSPAFHTTGRSAAMYLASYGNEPIRALTRASREFLQNPSPGFASHPLLHKRGLLTLADADHVAMLDAPVFHDQYRLGVDAALMLVPNLRPGVIAGARYEPEAADIDVDLLLQSYLRLARAEGARLSLGQRVVDARRVAEQWRLSTDAGEDVVVDLVINAAGAWADELAGLFGAQAVGLSPRRRTMILIDPPTGLSVQKWPFTMTVEESVYFRPESGKLTISPADETEDQPGDVQPEELDLAIGMDRFLRLVDMPVSRISHSWAGLRTFAPDRTPVFGPDPHVPGFFWFAGQGGYGIQIAPAAAALGAALALEASLPERLVEEGIMPELFAPARFHQGCPA